MKWKHYAAGALLVIGLGWLHIASTEPSAAQAVKQGSVQKWEYTAEIRNTPDVSIPAFNRLGANGWELCLVTSTTDYGSNTTYYIFKRPKKR